MKINHGRVADMTSSERGETFTGTVWSEPLLRDAPGVIINTVFFPPGVRTHWHGGGPDTYVSHIAISLGATNWEDAVTDEEYSKAGRET